MQVFLTVNNVEIKINTDVNVKSWLTKEYVIKDLFGILVIVSVNVTCEFDKSFDVGEYLDYKNCKCRKKLIDKLIEECTENLDEVKIAGMALFERKNDCKSSCTVYVVLIAIMFTISIETGTYFIYYKYMNHNKKNYF